MKYIATSNKEWNLDATYQIMACKKGLWIISCKDVNQKVFPILFFLVPNETTISLSYILLAFKNWIGYEPDCFINDCQKSIQNSI